MFCCGKNTFVETKDVFRRDKHVFVATKMVLVAAPANDRTSLQFHERYIRENSTARKHETIRYNTPLNSLSTTKHGSAHVSKDTDVKTL